MTRQEIMLNEYRNRIEVADNVLSETRAKLTKAEHDRDRYKAEIERLKSQQQEIERLKVENDKYAELFKMKDKDFFTITVEDWEKFKSGVLAQIKQAKIDVLNELKGNIKNAIDTYYNSQGGGHYLAEDVIDDIDELIKEAQND